MKKMYEKYLELKKENKDKMYLFKNGKFYIFIGEDCDLINEYVVLKKVKFSNDSLKCGFPCDRLEDYLKVFNNHGLNIQIVDNYESDVSSIIKSLDLDNLTPIRALEILKELKEKI